MFKRAGTLMMISTVLLSIGVLVVSQIVLSHQFPPDVNASVWVPIGFALVLIWLSLWLEYRFKLKGWPVLGLQFATSVATLGLVNLYEYGRLGRTSSVFIWIGWLMGFAFGHRKTIARLLARNRMREPL